MKVVFRFVKSLTGPPDAPPLGRRRAVPVLKRATRSPWVRGLVSLGFLVIVFSQLDVGSLRAALARGQWGLFAAAVVVLLLAFVVGATRWYKLLAAADIHVSFAATMRAYFAGLLASSFLPGAIAGDVARVLLVGGVGTRARTTTTVLFDRVTIFVVAVGLAWIALWPAEVPGSLVFALVMSTVALVGVCVVLALSMSGALLIRRYTPAAFRAPGHDAFVALRKLLTLRVLLGSVTGLGIGYEALAILSVWLAARCIGVDVSFWTITVIAPPILILSALPISIGGLGVREASYVGLLGEVGVNASEATLVGLLAGASFLLAALPGAIGLAHRGRRDSVESSVS